MTITVIVGYLVLVAAIGGLLARRSQSANAWAIAGGNMGWLMVAVGVAGTRIGGVGTYGVAGNVMTTGLWNLWYAVNTLLALALVGLFFAIPFRRLGLQTVSEIFRVRFGSKRCQVLTSLCVQTEYLIVNILEPFVIGSILAGVTGMPFGAAVFVGAGVLIFYTSLGGLWGSAVTNLIHCAVVIVGLSVVGYLGLRDLGGWSAMEQKIDSALLQAGGLEPEVWWSFVGLGWLPVLAMFFSATIHTPAASVYVNFSSAAKRERDVLPAFLIGGLIASVMPLLAGWIGMQTLAKYGSESGLRSYTAITQLAIDLSPLIGGVALAAILAAVISSGGPILLASATMFVRDWIPGSHDWSPERRLRAFRATTVVYGLLAALIAWQGEITSILDLLLLGFAMVVPPAIAIGYLIYWRRTTEAACFWGIALGYAIGLLWYLAIRLADTGLILADPGVEGTLWHRLWIQDGGLDPSYITTLVPLVVVPVWSLIARTDTDRAGRDEFYARLRRKTDRVMD